MDSVSVEDEPGTPPLDDIANGNISASNNADRVNAKRVSR